jgi:hypothetical protein
MPSLYVLLEADPPQPNRIYICSPTDTPLRILILSLIRTIFYALTTVPQNSDPDAQLPFYWRTVKWSKRILSLDKPWIYREYR